MMNRRTLVHSTVVAATLLVVAAPLNAAKKKNPPRAEIKDVVELVTNSLAQACATEQNKKMCDTLAEINLTLHTELDKDGKVGVSIFGISLGGHREKDTYNEFSLTLRLPPPAEVRTAETVKVSDALIQAFQNFLDASAAAKNGKFRLTATGFYLELGFTVQYGVSGGTSGFSLIPIFPDIAGKVERKDVQTIRFTFGK
jgi:hypothetical protein